MMIIITLRKSLIYKKIMQIFMNLHYFLLVLCKNIFLVLKIKVYLQEYQVMILKSLKK